MILTVVLLVILCDILTKYLVVQLLAPLHASVTVIPGVIDFTYATNRGAAFSILSDSRWIFMSVSVIFIVFLILLLKKMFISHPLFNISAALILGGGISNMIDRIFLGYVVDFIEFTFIDFAIFNIADTAISLGACGVVVYFIFFDKTVFPSKKKGDSNAT